MLETYLPGAVESGTLMAAQLNATSVHESQCVADWMVYKASQTYASTDFWCALLSKGCWTQALQGAARATAQLHVTVRSWLISCA